VANTYLDESRDYLDGSKDLQVIERLTDEFCSKYDPDLYLVDDATDMLERLSKVSRQFDAAKMRTARRLEKVDAHKDQGFNDAANWLSSFTGESAGQAQGKLETAKKVEAHPRLSEAVKKGKLSEAKAKEIAGVADRCPQEADRLVETALFMNHGELKRVCDNLRRASESQDDEITRHERIRKARFLRTWTDADGVSNLLAKMTPDALAVISAGLGHFETEIFNEARKSGQRESHQAYLLDALVAMARASATGTGTDADGSDGNSESGDSDDSDPGDQDSATRDTKKARTKTNNARALIRIRLDLEAYLRGYAILGETCSIPGFGPVPVSLARTLMGDAILELVITKGVNVTTVISDSRFVRKALRIALEERDPVCVVPGCNRSDPLERDHWQVDYSDKGPTCIDNLCRLCKYHHLQKTHHGWKLDGGPGQWRFYKPDCDTDADPDTEVTDTAEASEAKRTATSGNDPPTQEGML
jgi:hypothetical protein